MSIRRQKHSELFSVIFIILSKPMAYPRPSSTSREALKTNRESGLGRSDLLLLSAPYDGIAIIVEIKVSDTYAQLEEKALSALEQIEEKQYDVELRLEGYHTFIKYGISFYKKLCKVVCN